MDYTVKITDCTQPTKCTISDRIRWHNTTKSTAILTPGDPGWPTMGDPSGPLHHGCTTEWYSIQPDANGDYSYSTDLQTCVTNPVIVVSSVDR